MEYTWLRDSASQDLVLAWRKTPTEEWQRYYNPIPHHIYRGGGQMTKMRQLRQEGYVYVKTDAQPMSDTDAGMEADIEDCIELVFRSPIIG